MTTIPFNAYRFVRALNELGVFKSQAKIIGIIPALVKRL